MSNPDAFLLVMPIKFDCDDYTECSSTKRMLILTH